MKNVKKRKKFTLEHKIQAIRLLEQKVSRNIIINKFGMSSATLTNIMKNKKHIAVAYSYLPKKAFKIKKPKNEELDKELFEWFCIQRNRKIPLSGPIMKEKADEIAAKLGYLDFKCGNGWLHRFKYRHSISFGIISGESESVNPEIVKNFLNVVLPQLLLDYKAEDIFNADETALFYKLLPNKTFKIIGEACRGTKISKDRLTVYLCASMKGEKRRPLVIGKNKNPRCFKNKNFKFISYQSNKKAWMKSDIFIKELILWDEELRLKGRKIILFVDNCSSHPQISDRLSNIRIEFLPPNTTSLMQPLDQGIIRSFKTHYKKTIINKMIRNLDIGEPFNITVYDALKYIDLSWQNVSSTVIENCFLKSGLYITNNKSCTLNGMFDFENEEYLDNVKIFNVCGLDSKKEITEFIDFDNDINISSEDNLTFENKDNAKNTSEITENVKNISMNSALEALDMLKDFLYENEFYSINGLKEKLADLSDKMEKEYANAKRVQKNLDMFLIKK